MLFRPQQTVQPRGPFMLAYLNVAILSFWLLAEVVPMLADNLADIENRTASEKISESED